MSKSRRRPARTGYPAQVLAELARAFRIKVSPTIPDAHCPAQCCFELLESQLQSNNRKAAVISQLVSAKTENTGWNTGEADGMSVAAFMDRGHTQQKENRSWTRCCQTQKTSGLNARSSRTCGCWRLWVIWEDECSLGSRRIRGKTTWSSCHGTLHIGCPKAHVRDVIIVGARASITRGHKNPR